MNDHSILMPAAGDFFLILQTETIGFPLQNRILAHRFRHHRYVYLIFDEELRKIDFSH